MFFWTTRVQETCARFVFTALLGTVLCLYANQAASQGVVFGGAESSSGQGIDDLLDPILIEGNGSTPSPRPLVKANTKSVRNAGTYSQNSTSTELSEPSNPNATNSRTSFVNSAQGTTEASYVLSTGDRISISVFGEPELSVLDLIIASDEVINYPLIGSLQLKGKTSNQIQNELSQRLQDGYLVNPRVTVTVLEYRPFYIQGGVLQNGAMPYEPGLTVDKAFAMAGGLRDGVRLDDLKIGRQGAPYERAEPAQRSSIVNPGDVVYVPLANEGASGTYIYVYGEVNSPGRYQIYDQITVEQAIILAGGFNDFASKRRVNIKRIENGEEQELKRVKLNEAIFGDDVITIGAGLF